MRVWFGPGVERVEWGDDPEEVSMFGDLDPTKVGLENPLVKCLKVT